MCENWTHKSGGLCRIWDGRQKEVWCHNKQEDILDRPHARIPYSSCSYLFCKNWKLTIHTQRTRYTRIVLLFEKSVTWLASGLIHSCWKSKLLTIVINIQNKDDIRMLQPEYFFKSRALILDWLNKGRVCRWEAGNNCNIWWATLRSGPQLTGVARNSLLLYTIM